MASEALPPVSVVITCFNLESFIGEAIESVQRQDYAGQVEILVCDDASTDSSRAVIQRYPNVRQLWSDQNQGVLLATVRGIEAASHELLFFLDGDDVWEPEKLSTMVPLFLRHEQAALVTHDLTYIDGAGRPMSRETLVRRAFVGLEGDQAHRAVREAILTLSDHVWLGSAVAVHRQRGWLNEFIDWARHLPDPRNTYQDWPLAYWVASLADTRTAYEPFPLLRYRVHGANHSGGTGTAARLRRNIVRSFNTFEAIRELAARREMSERYQGAIRRRIAYLRYMLDLLDGRRLKATRQFVRLLPELKQRRVLLKEAVRLVGTLLLGNERFVRLSARRSLFRHLRVS